MAKQNRVLVLAKAHLQGFVVGVRTFLAQRDVQVGMLLGVGILGLAAIAYPPAMLVLASPLTPALVAKITFITADTILAFGFLGGVVSTACNALSNYTDYKQSLKAVRRSSHSAFSDFQRDAECLARRCTRLGNGAFAVLHPVTPFAKALRAGALAANDMCFKNKEPFIYFPTNQAGKAVIKTIVALDRPFN